MPFPSPSFPFSPSLTHMCTHVLSSKPHAKTNSKTLRCPQGLNAINPSPEGRQLFSQTFIPWTSSAGSACPPSRLPRVSRCDRSSRGQSGHPGTGPASLGIARSYSIKGDQPCFEKVRPQRQQQLQPSHMAVVISFKL